MHVLSLWSGCGLVAAALVMAGCTSQPGAPDTSPTTPTPSFTAPSPTPTPSPTPSPTPTPEASVDDVDCTKVKCVALTYDDGPGPLTDQLLDTYARYHAKTTFFVLADNARAYPDVIAREQQMGMEIANHTTTHPNLTTLDEESIRRELATCSDTVAELTGTPPAWLRPPYGEHDERVDRIAGELGMKVTTWSTSPEDWVYNDPETIAKLTIERVSPGSIILMHDIHQWTVDAAPAILEELTRQGYHMVTISQIVPDAQPGGVYYSGLTPTG